MSHANGQVRFPDGGVFHYEYDGASDAVISHLYKTYEEMQANWRKDSSLECTCGKDEPVELFTDYGGGFFWRGRACKKCNAITQGRYDDDYENLQDGRPGWAIDNTERTINA